VIQAKNGSVVWFPWLVSALLALTALVLGYRALTAGADAVVIVEWTTASELDTAGFNLYRSDNPEGPFIRVNERLIPASMDPLIGGSYVYTDTNVVAGRTYYYQLEDVEVTGKATRHGPIAVKAEGGRTTEMLLAGVLLGLAALCLAASLRWRVTQPYVDRSSNQ
jgi:hypothetical protein